MFKRWFNIITLVVMLLGTFALAAPAPAAPARGEIAAPPPPEAKSAPAVEPAEQEREEISQETQPPVVSFQEALSKLHPDLRELAQTASPALPEEVGTLALGEPGVIFVQVFAKAGTDLSAYMTDVKARPVIDKSANPTQAFVGSIQPINLLKVASLSDVGAIIPMVIEKNGEPMPYPPDDEVQVPEKGPDDWAALRANAAKLREGSLPWGQAKAFGDGRTPIHPMDWFEQSPAGPHKAQVAWGRGYDGTGVTVAVNDDGTDFAHPDLMGTQKIYSSTVHSEYNGWPMAFSPFSQYLYAADPLYITNGQPGVDYADTSETPDVSPCGSGISCLQYEPLIDWATWTGPHTYVISDTMSKSGVVHIGTHPDISLRDYVWGEKVAVLVCDPNSAGVYDTVYVDLDDDYDFRDEKPLTKADVNDLANTRNNMIAYRDMNGDGLADLSGGMLYFIADGVSDIPASDYMWDGLTPDNGDLVAFTGGSLSGGYSHGTQCASNVVGQGVVQGATAPNNDMLPSFRDLPGDGKPAGAVFGGAPGAKVVPVADIYWNHEDSTIDAYTFGAIGYDGCDQTGWDVNTGGVCTDTDAIQMSSNSYGSSSTDNDEWEFRGRYVSNVQRWYAPNMQLLFSTGNGAPAYGTAAPPSPDTAIAVGASTEFGSTGWDSITDTTQIMNNDVTPFSNRGPGARGTAGVDVVAGGAFAAGDEALNYYSISAWGAPNGNLSWDSWGGTSRSAPEAMGILATIYQAYKDANGVWPTYDVAKELFMSTARDLDYDVFSQGAGSVNADRGTAVAGGLYGLFVDDNDWQPGDYRGNDYPGFAHVAYPGDVFTKTFTINNTGAQTITAGIADTELRRIGSKEFTFTVTQDMVTAESAYGAENQDNFYKAFNYFIPITATAGMSDTMYGFDIPPNTDLMVVRQMFPYSEYDVDGDYGWDNRFYLAVYNWQDVNGDGNVWEDKDGNGVVNFINGPDIVADASPELVWDDARTELDRWEFGRFSYHRPGGNRNEMWVHDPLDRMIDGLFIGLRHHPGSSYPGPTTLSYRIDFYAKEDVPWLATGDSSLEVAPGTSETFVATTTVPVDMEPGSYEAALEITDPGWLTYTEDTSVIPVALSVAAVFTDGMQLGGYDAYDADAPYPNGAVRGLFDWTWRAESGDWRFYYVDADIACSETALFTETFEGSWPPAGWQVVVNKGAGWNLTPSYWGRANLTGGSGEAAGADSDAYGGGMDTELWSAPIDLTGVSAAKLTFQSNFQDFAGAGDAWVDVSANNGLSWANVYYQTEDDSGGTLRTIDLSAYAGKTILLRWHYDDNGMWAWFWQIDDVTVSDVQCSPYSFGSHVLIKDEWDDAAPHTDIDTIVLGPTQDCASNGVGCGGLQFPEPGYFGPYTLDTVGKSVNANAGGGTWLFDTTSGSNEDWVTAPFQDGLHEFLQHNVLFEGDKFDVVFTKTLGTLQATPTNFTIDTYENQGELGVVSVQSSLSLNGLEADAFGLGGPEYFTAEPIGFVSSNSIEWTDSFNVDHAAKIELWTSSADISDIDLYLFYCGPAGAGPCVQRASSTTGTANEHVMVSMPDNGVWLVGINNWSGPAGHFDLTRVVVQGTDLSVSGLPTGAIAAGDNVTFTVSFSRTMVPGETYEGLLLVGPPEAPALHEIPITINSRRAMDKSVDKSLAFPGDELNYTINIYNYFTPDTFGFVDPIPANTEFLSAGGATYDAANNRLAFNGVITTSRQVTLTVRVTDTAAAGVWITNTATLTSATQFTGEQTASAGTQLGAANFQTSYKAASAEVDAGQVITYAVHVINTGDELAYVTFTDPIPVSTTYVSHVYNGPYFDYNSTLNQMEWAGNIAPGDEWIFSFDVTAGSDAAWTTITNTAQLSVDGVPMTLVASTNVLPPYQIYLPLVMRNSP